MPVDPVQGNVHANFWLFSLILSYELVRDRRT